MKRTRVTMRPPRYQFSFEKIVFSNLTRSIN